MDKPLTHQEVVRLAQDHERKAVKPPFGYPVSIISRLISRCLFIEKEKNIRNEKSEHVAACVQTYILDCLY